MTPIDLLIQRLAENGILHSSDIAEANELFKQQIIDAFDEGCSEHTIFGVDYYKLTFKNTKE